MFRVVVVVVVVSVRRDDVNKDSYQSCHLSPA